MRTVTKQAAELELGIQIVERETRLAKREIELLRRIATPEELEVWWEKKGEKLGRMGGRGRSGTVCVSVKQTMSALVLC